MLVMSDGKIVSTTPSNVPKKAKMSLASKSSCLEHLISGDDRNVCDYCSDPKTLCAYGSKHYNGTINEDSCLGDSGGNNS